MEKKVSEPFIFVDRIDKAVRLAYGAVTSMPDTPLDFNLEDMRVVWFCKTLKNWKAILSPNFPESPLIEVSYNGEAEETYIDLYQKIENVRIPD